MFLSLTGCYFFFFKQKTAYEMRISDWSSDVCSSDLVAIARIVSSDSSSPASDRTQRETSCGLADGGSRRLRRHHCPQMVRSDRTARRVLCDQPRTAAETSSESIGADAPTRSRTSPPPKYSTEQYHTADRTRVA